MTLIAQDVSGGSEVVSELYQAIISKHDIMSMFQQETLDKQAVELLCADPCMQTMALYSAKLERFIAEVILLLQDVQGVSCLVSTTTSSMLSAAVDDATKFLAQGAEGAMDAKATVTMAHVRRLQANMTISQAFCRELQPGETRIGLVNRCLALLEKRRSKCEPSFLKKATAIKGGK